jgi:hypothetical protein
MRLLVIGLCMPLLLGCQVETETHRVSNQTNEIIYLYLVGPEGEYALGSVKPGYQMPLVQMNPHECSTVTLVARAADGRELARRTTPFCPEDTWIVGGGLSTGAPSP